MRRAFLWSVAALLVLVLIPAAHARDPERRGLRVMQEWSPGQYQPPEEAGQLFMSEAAVDTYLIVYYDFEPASWQGWERVDNTAQVAIFWHVEDYLEPELAGLPGPIEGTKSAWCGAPPAPHDYICSWANERGYGNAWNQPLASDPIYSVGPVTISYKGYFDSEPGHDFTRLEYFDVQTMDWVQFASYTGEVSTVGSHTIAHGQHKTKLRFHFTSDGGWSDQDGLYDSDGAAHIDSITVSDATGVLDYEDFEAAADGATSCGIWHGENPGYGRYSGLKSSLRDFDPCNDNLTTQIVFFAGSPYQSSEYINLQETPFCTGEGGITAPCQNEMVVSPDIDMTRCTTNRNNVQDAAIPAGELPDLGGILFGFTVYRDLPLKNLVFYTWQLRNAGGCPFEWLDRQWVYYGENKDYFFASYEVGDYMAAADTINIRLFVSDMCDVWYLVNGDCANHTPAPWFDNVWVKRYSLSGPQWYYRAIDLFQDNFPEVEFDIESYVRADAANDVNPESNPGIRPGDSIVVDCTSPIAGGLAADGGWPAIYMHVKTTYIGPPLPAPQKPPLFGPSLAGDCGRYKSDDGVWTVIQGDTARTAAGIVMNKYMFDLNDSLFTRGYRVDYYFSAQDLSGKTSQLPRYASGTGRFFEWTCLPTLASEVLYVDDFDGIGSQEGMAQIYWTPTFYAALASPNYSPDRYDVNGPSSMASNGPGSRAKNYQLTSVYDVIVWDSGDLESGTITDGTSYGDKSNDAQMLVDWMNFSGHDCGLWVCGDGVASDLDGSSSAIANELMETWCGTELAGNPSAGSYYALTGEHEGAGVTSPLVKGASGSIYIEYSIPHEFYVFGGCPAINRFDVLDKTANGAYALQYPDYEGNHYYAGIQSVNTNSGGYTIRTMWWGFSMMYVRDKDISYNYQKIRRELAWDTFCWMQLETTEGCVGPCAAETPAAYKLDQNYPNPFNPSTAVSFDMRKKGRVTIAVYDVTGARVRTLVDGVREAGSYTVTWDGTNDEGRALASGVYFYKMETGEYSKTRKMVLLR